MKIKLPETDRLLGVSAMIISVLTLIIFIYQTSIINQQSKLSVKPQLSFILIQAENDSIMSFEQIVKNKGLGPAIIKNTSIYYDKKTYSIDFENFVFEKFPEVEKYVELKKNTNIIEGGIISSNESITVYKIELKKSKISDVFKYLDFDTQNVEPKWQLEIEYTSMYEDEIWKINDTENTPMND